MHTAHRIGIFAHVVPGNAGRARGDRNQRGHHADEGRLARAVRAQQAKDFLFLHVEGHVIDGGEVAVLLDDVVDFDGVTGSPPL